MTTASRSSSWVTRFGIGQGESAGNASVVNYAPATSLALEAKAVVPAVTAPTRAPVVAPLKQTRVADLMVVAPSTLSPTVLAADGIVTEDARLAYQKVLKLAPGKSIHDLVGWSSHWMPGPLPARPLGGIVGLDAGKAAAFSVTLERGSYVLVCFIPDKKDGKSHLLHGMVKEIRVE